jgi:transketolase
MATSKKRARIQTGRISASKFQIGQRRGQYFAVPETPQNNSLSADQELVATLERMDVVYRTLCAVLFNFVPKSGHPGGSISSGRIVQSLLYSTMEYDFTDPDAKEADQICFAAGHKALGLYAAWALRNECMRIAHPALLPEEKKQLRLEDLLGFRRSPTTATPLFKKYGSKALDGHPTPATPFVSLATGASGVGMTTATGLAFGALDLFGQNAPRVHIIEGEGGLTPGRVYEIMAAAGSAQISNIVLHVDWNQASIDSDHVCREGERPGDYVQWNPCELAYLHDWNVVNVADGFDFKQVLAAQHLATTGMKNHQPTAVVYRTVKGWKYGMEGRVTHGAGHDFCSQGFHDSLAEFERGFGERFPRFEGDQTPENIEEVFFQFLALIRKSLEKEPRIAGALCARIEDARQRLKDRGRTPREDAPNLSAIYEDGSLSPGRHPAELALRPGAEVTTRGVLGDTLNFLNRKTNGAFIGSSADLFGSTSLADLADGISDGYFNLETQAGSRLIMLGGICEDAIGGFMAGLSSFGYHIGVGSSYGAFIAALQHVSARLHAIGQEARARTFGDRYRPFVMICAHAGPKTGEDGPTHADPQALQLIQENFPRGTMITLTPWDTQEIWPLMIASLAARPAIIAPFVTRPSESVVDRAQFGLPPAFAAAKGVYALRKANRKNGGGHGTVVLQGNGVARIFITEVLPQLETEGLDLNVFYVASAELFDLLPEAEKEEIFPESLAREAMGITEFTLPTMFRWVTSNEGRNRTLSPFAGGHYLGSGQAEMVIAEAGLHGAAQLEKVRDYAEFTAKGTPNPGR